MTKSQTEGKGIILDKIPLNKDLTNDRESVVFLADKINEIIELNNTKIKTLKNGKWIKWNGKDDVTTVLVEELITKKDFKKYYKNNFKNIKINCPNCGDMSPAIVLKNYEIWCKHCYKLSLKI